MAIEQINSAAFDYDVMLATIEGAYVGKSNITISEFDSDAAPDVKVGSKFEVNGALFKVLTADETPTGYAGIANSTTFYIIYDVSAGAFVFTSVTPTWNDALQGWYEVGETDRYFFSMFKDSGGTLYERKRKFEKQIEHPITLSTEIIKLGDWNMDANDTHSKAHGLTDHTKIRSVSVMILRDIGDDLYPLNQYDSTASGDVSGGISLIDATNIYFGRKTGGKFDSVDFDSTSFNRGWMTIEYEE